MHAPNQAPVEISSQDQTADPFALKWESDLGADKPNKNKWLWQGYLARGSVTLFVSRWKSGKTTLITALLRKLGPGGELAGLPLAAGKVLIVSEEPDWVWEERKKIQRFGKQVCWICKPFLGRPKPEQWLALLDKILGVHEKHGLDLVVIDSLPNLAPFTSENESGEMLKVLLPFQRLTERGLSVLLSHHPHKGKVRPGQASRGSGALPGFVDIIVEMSYLGRREANERRRRLLGFSRHQETPPAWVIELNAAGTDYITWGCKSEPDFEYGWPIVRDILDNADRKLTREDILQQWPENRVRPRPSTLWKWLDRQVKEGEILRDGGGRRNDPLVYMAPGMEDQWQKNMLESLVRGWEK